MIIAIPLLGLSLGLSGVGGALYVRTARHLTVHEMDLGAVAPYVALAIVSGAWLWAGVA